MAVLYVLNLNLVTSFADKPSRNGVPAKFDRSRAFSASAKSLIRTAI